MKKCQKCQKLKEKNFYYKKKSSKDGLRNICIECWKKYNKKYRLKNVKNLKKNSKKWRKNNPKYNKKYMKKIKDKYGLGAGTIQRYGFKLSLKVYERAKRKCQICGEINDLTIHHKNGKGRNFENKGLKPDNNINNLIVLCRKCHGSIHGKQNYKNRKRGENK